MVYRTELKRKLELLSPAKNAETGIMAINNGADAIYIGAPLYSARKAAGNMLEDIQKVIDYAHHFYSKVFIAMNTILYDEELKEAEILAKELYTRGADALIIQDMGLLQLDLPPIALHASTQMHNYELERIKFLDKLGFQRIVLARELSLEQIKEIRKEVKAELEVFIHGALCVSLSGQCYMSHFMSGRSANRGECAQPCRMKWDIEDKEGNKLLTHKHILSLKDLNLTDYIHELADIGIDSFKIEGRMKDGEYVANITNHYNSVLNKYIDHNPHVTRVSSGKIYSSFIPDPLKSFNRGTTDYFIKGRSAHMANFNTPKSMGKRIGVVKKSFDNTVEMDSIEPIHNGDGICFIQKGELVGLRINKVEESKLFFTEKVNIPQGTEIYRNYDHTFELSLKQNPSYRKIRIKLKIEVENGEISFFLEDEDKNRIIYKPKEAFPLAQKAEQKERIIQQLCKWGNTLFECTNIEYVGEVLFIPSAQITDFKNTLQRLIIEEREKNRPVLKMSSFNKEIDYIGEGGWKLNISNKKSAEFYQLHHAKAIETSFELDKTSNKRELMKTRYCILLEMGKCLKKGNHKNLPLPLYISNNKFRFQLEFDCKDCFMKILSC